MKNGEYAEFKNGITLFKESKNRYIVRKEYPQINVSFPLGEFSTFQDACRFSCEAEKTSRNVLTDDELYDYEDEFLEFF